MTMWRRAPLLLAILACSLRCDHKDQITPTGQTTIVHPRDASGDALALPQRPKPELTILYSSDVHGRVSPEPGSAGGLGRRATVVDEIKLEGGGVVQVDAGDLLAGAGDDVPGLAYGRDLIPKIVFASYARMGVDAATLGERDLELGRERLKATLKTADISVVAANLYGKGEERPFPPDRIVQAGGQFVGIFGVLDVPAERNADLQRWGFRTSDAAEAAKAEAQSLRSRGARLVVGLFHVLGGRARAEEILSQTSGIDVAVLGHVENSAAEEPAVVGGTQVVFAGSPGDVLGRLDVRDLRLGEVAQFEDQKVKLTDAIRTQVGVASIERGAIADQRRANGVKEPLYPPRWDYASNDACVGCHNDENDQWKTTDHAKALATLHKYKHDRDSQCLGCHMTGYLQPFQTTNYDQMVKYFSNVGCESCHGPSAAHVRSLDKKRGTSRKVSPEVCMGCHTDDQSLDPFDYVTALKSVVGPGHGVLTAKR
ncbi:MAG: multiheme c-type cytochrome [Polyangiaceae bacterium]